MERLCGNCAYGGTAYDRFGNEDENYVICQLKEIENLNRRPDRYHTTSAVSRMHSRREACLNWRPMQRPSRPVEQPLPLAEGDDLIRPPAAARPSNALQEEINQLKLQLIQKDQMITSLQTQNLLMSEQLHTIQEELRQLKQTMHQVRFFDPSVLTQLDYLTLLGITRESKPEEIKEAYRNRMKFYHPDRFAAIARLLNEAYDTLMDPVKRREYLQKLGASGKNANQV